MKIRSWRRGASNNARGVPRSLGYGCPRAGACVTYPWGCARVSCVVPCTRDACHVARATRARDPTPESFTKAVCNFFNPFLSGLARRACDRVNSTICDAVVR